ncbi:MAG: UpxY family transcription antiterminator [Prevotella sp.]|nr:UpxY family transcription antiterminator [Prevotella sp.]
MDNPTQENPKFWFIARVSPNTEKSTRSKLQALGYEVFVASRSEVCYWKNGIRRKKKIVEKVVITQYIFLHISLKERMEIIRYPFIKEFLKNKATQHPSSFALISDDDMACLIQMFSQNERPVLFDTGNYTIGEKVCLHLGSNDYTACVVRKRGDKNTYYGIRISELGCAYMEVPSTVLSKPA